MLEAIHCNTVCISQVWKQLKSWLVGDYITASVSIKWSITELLKKNKAALYALYKISSKDIVLTEKDQYTEQRVCVYMYKYIWICVFGFIMLIYA